MEEQAARAARARRVFDQDLREVSAAGTRAARRLVVPALWGAALLGGVVVAIGLIQLFRRPVQAPSLLRVSIEPPPRSRRLLPAVGGAVARFALQRFMAQYSSPDQLATRRPSPDAGFAGVHERS